MAEKGKRGNGRKGFASMDEESKKDIASRGGRASAQGDTSNRGFASMDKDRQREISSQGGRASQSTQNRKNEDGAQADGITGESEAPDKDLNTLEEEDNLESSTDHLGSAAYSETDEDEDEGLGDANLGRSTREGGLSK